MRLIKRFLPAIAVCLLANFSLPGTASAADAMCEDSGIFGPKLFTDICWACLFPIKVSGVQITPAQLRRKPRNRCSASAKKAHQASTSRASSQQCGSQRASLRMSVSPAARPLSVESPCHLAPSVPMAGWYRTMQSAMTWKTGLSTRLTTTPSPCCRSSTCTRRPSAILMAIWTWTSFLSPKLTQPGERNASFLPAS